MKASRIFGFSIILAALVLYTLVDTHLRVIKDGRYGPVVTLVPRPADPGELLQEKTQCGDSIKAELQIGAVPTPVPNNGRIAFIHIESEGANGRKHGYLEFMLADTEVYPVSVSTTRTVGLWKIDEASYRIDRQHALQYTHDGNLATLSIIDNSVYILCN